MSYAFTVLYPAPSDVTSHTIRPDSSSSSAELFAPIVYARAPFSPFTRTTCDGWTAGWIIGCGMPYGFRYGF